MKNMKQLGAVVLVVMFALLFVVPFAAAAESATGADTVPVEPFSWDYLATVAGAAALTLLAAQFLKFPIDKVWKIPTRVLVYCIAAVVLIVGTAFTTGLTAQSILLALSNAFVAAFSAMGAYEITFAKANHS